MHSNNNCLLRADFSCRVGHFTDPVVDDFQKLEHEDRNTALMTIAFLFGNLNHRYLSKLGLQTSMLALYAAGAAVKLTRQELWDLSSELRSFADLFRLPELQKNPNGQVLRYVFNHAMQRASREAIRLGSHGELPVGFKLIRLQASASCIPVLDDELKRLRTIAFVNLHPEPEQVRPENLAMAMLAIWAAGAQVELSRRDYDRLKDSIQTQRLRGGRSRKDECGARDAEFVLEMAEQRLEAESSAGEAVEATQLSQSLSA